MGTGKSDKEKPSIPSFSRFTRELVEFFEKKSVHLFLLIFEIEFLLFSPGIKQFLQMGPEKRVNVSS